MDFLDPKKQKKHARRLVVGYILIGLVLLLATTILLYQAFGYGIDRHGRIFQNGLVFLSSLPEDAEIYIDGERKENNTNTRLLLPAGQYVVELKREGYRTWKRAITVEGGTTQRFDYPVLFASTLEPQDIKQYSTTPFLVTQSPDKRWVFVQVVADTFDLYDLDASNPVPASFSIPAEVLAAGSTTLSWKETAWARDNRYLVLQRLYERDGQQSSEYVLVDRENPALARNLTVAFGFSPTILQLRGEVFDQYYLYDQPNGALFTASLDRPTPKPYLDGVLSFQPDGPDTVLYVTNKEAPPGKALIRMKQGEDNYTIRQVASDAAPYLLDLARYDSAWFVAVGASGEDKIYVYKNPIESLKSSSGEVLVPVHILKVDNPTYIAFSPEARFVAIEAGQQFATYDVKNGKGYAYEIENQLDAAHGHATWADGYRLTSTSEGHVLIFDYDGTNRQLLSPASAAAQPLFTREYRRLFTLNGANVFTSTNLRIQQQ